VLGQSAGVQNATILASNMPQHNHLINVSNANGAQTNPSNNFIAAPLDDQGNSVVAYNTSASSPATLASATVSLAGNGVPINIQNPYLGINYIIAMTGIFPSRN
jgi:microcystin-dependent protein